MTPAMIIAAAQVAAQAIDLAIRLRNEARRRGEMTPEEDALFDQILQSRMQAPHWQPAPPMPTNAS